MRESCESLQESQNYESQDIKNFRNEKINKSKVLIISHYKHNDEVCRVNLSSWWDSLRYDRSWKDMNDYWFSLDNRSHT